MGKTGSQRMTLVKTPFELRRAIKEKRLAAMLGVEGGHMIEDKIDNLDNFMYVV
jgi:membrane dipeptidase